MTDREVVLLDLLSRALPYMYVGLAASEDQPDEYMFEEDVEHLEELIDDIVRALQPTTPEPAPAPGV